MAKIIRAPQGPKGIKTLAAESWLNNLVNRTISEGRSELFPLKGNITEDHLRSMCRKHNLLLFARRSENPPVFALIANFKQMDRAA